MSNKIRFFREVKKCLGPWERYMRSRGFGKRYENVPLVENMVQSNVQIYEGAVQISDAVNIISIRVRSLVCCCFTLFGP